ncbi:LapA family protein [Ideonella sp. A 288]|uniref:LapA family protein n=1 Tax=Ideonella sp. A 288 TaxID=1962181 RepID=UPI000B4B0CF4|nr:LapA family protein [Ideonella sp. A 288]
MNLRAFSLTLVLAFVLLAAFATLNWVTMATPSTLNLGFAEVSAPLGLVLLVFTAAISGLFIVYLVLLQAGVILEARRLTKEVKAQRELADTAEASRFTELHTLLEGELRRLDAQGAESTREFGARIERSERAMQDRLAEAAGALSAHLGEIEDKLDRALVPLPALGVSPQAGR